MTTPQRPATAGLQLPRPQLWQQQTSIAAPSHEAFTSHFGHAFPKPTYLHSDLGATAVYDLPPQLSQKKRPILMIHGANTPALGLLPMAKGIQALDPDAHIVLFDLWGHGLSSTPIAAHTAQLFHAQIFQVLGYMQWPSAHIIGYSFGGSTAVSFANTNPWMCKSVTLLGTAGLMDYAGFSPEMRGLLEDSSGREDEAIDCVMDWLEGGPLVVPADWKAKMEKGELVAEALREWERNEHIGYPHSVLSMFRYGWVYGRHEKFREFAGLPIKKFAVVGETDPVCSRNQLLEVGLDNVEEVKNEGHGFVRSAATQTARIIHDFLIKI